jgi:flagellar motility protein MotE (MotC chaperone)
MKKALQVLRYSGFLFLVLAIRAEAEAPEAGAPPAEQTAAEQAAAAAAAPAVEKPKAAKYKRDAQECITDPVVIEDLKARREELEIRERDLTAKETEMVAKARALDEEIKRLEEIREQIAKMEEAQAKNNEEKIAKVVETLEGMSPKNASQLFMQLDDGVAVTAMMRMTSQKVSKIMNQLDASRASKLTELLAGVSRAKKQNPASNGAAATQPMKGGETKL